MITTRFTTKCNRILNSRSFSIVRKYTDSHEWISDDGANVIKVGVSTYAQKQLGEVVFCDLPAVGGKFSKGQTLCTLESVKAVGEVYAPADGEVVDINSELEATPNLVNQDPEGNGWLVKLKYAGPGSFSEVSKSLKDAVAYKEFVASQDGH